VPSLAGSLRSAGESARAREEEVNGEAALAAPSAESKPVCFKTSLRDQRVLRKRDMGSSFSWCEFSCLDVSDQINLDERISGNSTSRSHSCSHRWNRAPLARRVDTIHGGIVFQIIKVDVYLQDLIHR